MRTSSFFLRFCLMLIALVNFAFAQKTSNDRMLEPEKLGTEFGLQNNHMGKEFYVSFHPIWDLYDIEYRLYVTSYVNTQVTIELPGEANKITKDVKAYEPTMFSSKNGDISITWMGSESELITNNGLRISAPDPISVFVYIPSRDYAGEGYQAIPTSSLGREYYNFSYYDFFYTGNSRYHPGGFIVISTEDLNDITINLNGKIKGAAKTKGGKDIGDQIKVKLNKGQTYLVSGDATTKGGLFDLTGTKITSAKPVAVVSYHQFTCISSYVANFGNWLSEMLMPANTWGKKYLTVNFTRNGNKGQLGDFFRILSCEDNTTWNCKYYDKSSGKFLGQQGTLLKNAGDFYEFNQDGTSQPSIRGVSIWEANKPIMVMQYGYSHQWDDDIIQSPVMITLTSMLQYSCPILFTAPGSFPSELTLMIVGDSSDNTNKLLSTVKFDGQKIIEKYPEISYNRIPFTNVYWIKFSVESGVHTITGSTGVAGYLHHPRPSSLGMYIGMNLNFIDKRDTVAPRTSITGTCGKFTMTISENLNVDTTQVDQGISKIVMTELSSNFSMSINEPEKFKPQNKIASQKVYFDVIDLSKPAKAFVYVSDRAGNYRLDTINYIPDQVEFLPKSIDFANVRKNEESTREIKIRNNGLIDYKVNKYSFPFSNKLKVIGSIPGIIKPSEEISLQISYTPSPSCSKLLDSLLIESACSKTSLVISGNTVEAKISCTDFEFPKTKVGEKSCNLEGTGAKIWSQGTDTLLIYEIDTLTMPFYYFDKKPTTPVSIAPGQVYNLPEICFEPADSLLYQLTVNIRSNAPDSASHITIKGLGQIITSVSEDKLSEFSITPNPATDYIEINVGAAQRAVPDDVSIFDILGECIIKVEQTSPSVQKIDVSHLAPGVYFVRVGDVVRQFVKM